MPSQAKRPPSPYSSSHSPRNISGSKAKVWRSLSGTGKQHATNQQIEKSREMWLRSLRQGTVEPHHHSRDETYKRKTTEEYWTSTFRSNASTDKTNTKSSPVKGVHGIQGTASASLALTSSSEYLKEQLGINTTTYRHKRSSSFSGTPQPGTPRYKPQEEMYDEILQLKKTITTQKSEFDMIKSKIRRLEEENSRKDRCIDQLIEQITVMSEGMKTKKGPATDNKLVINTLKQQKIKLEHNIKEKDDELQAARERIKNLRSRARQAKAAYVQEVMQLQEALKQCGEDPSMKSPEMEEAPSNIQKVKTLRQSVVKLTGENNRLQDENRSLKRDLERALDESDHSGDDDNDEKEKIKYSALSRSELVTLVKKVKKKDVSQLQEQKEQQYEEQLKLKKVIQNLKADINLLRNEKNHQTLEIERLQDDNEKLKEDKMDLLQHAQKQQPLQRRQNAAQSRIKESAEIERKQMRVRQQTAARSIQKHWKKYKQEKENENDEAISVIQSSFRGHAARQEMLHKAQLISSAAQQRNQFLKSHSQSTLGVTEEESEIEEEISSYSKEGEGINVIQAAMRGHAARSDLIKRPISRATISELSTNYSSDDF